MASVSVMAGGRVKVIVKVTAAILAEILDARRDAVVHTTREEILIGRCFFPPHVILMGKWVIK